MWREISESLDGKTSNTETWNKQLIRRPKLIVLVGIDMY